MRNWLDYQGEYEIQEDQKFSENWSKYLVYIRDNCKSLKTLAGFDQLQQHIVN